MKTKVSWKTSWKVMASGVSMTGLVLNLQAQSADAFSGINLSPTLLQSGALPLSSANISSLAAWSDAQLTALANVLDTTPTVAAADLPGGVACWSLQNPAMPPLPGDTVGLDGWRLSDGSVLLNDLDFDYSATAATALSARSMTMMAMSAEGGLLPPGAGGGGAYSPDAITNVPPNYGTNLWIAQTAVSVGYLTGIGSNTLADVPYEIQSRTNLALQMDWQSEGFIFGSELTNWTPLSVAQNNRTNLFIRLKSWASSDGSGLPDWWQLQYFGTLGVDPYGDPEGDGWNNLQKFQSGMNPNQFYPPPAPQNFTASYNANNGSIALNWSPAPGPVTGYSLQKSDYQTFQFTTNQVSKNTVNYADSIAGETPYYKPSLYVDYTLQAEYGTNGLSSPATANIESGDAPPAVAVREAQGRISLAIPNLPGDLSHLQIYRQEGDPAVDFLDVTGDYAQEDTFAYLNSPVADGYFEIPAASVTNGVCQLPDAQVPPFYNYQLWVQTVRSNGVASGWQPFNTLTGYGIVANTPLVDARQQLKDNLRFLLRAAAAGSPFAFSVNEGSTSWYVPPAYAWPFDNYLCSGFYGEGLTYFYEGFAELQPIHANCFYRNFVFDQNNLAHDGFLKTGCYGGGFYDAGGFDYLPCLTITNWPAYYFDVAGYLTNNAPVPSSQLTAAQTPWLLPNDGKVFALSGGTMPTENFYGLPYVSMKCAYVNTNDQQVVATYYPNDPLPTGVSGVEYLNAAQPVFTSAGYYFARPNVDPQPEQGGFATTNQTPLIMQGVGASQQIAGYAKLGLANGYPDVYAYLGQYFAQAYKVDANGNTTAATTGILSPYGNFFATEPGPAALVTMPDVDTGQQGTCMVYSVSVVIDRNQGSNMDLTFTGANATSQDDPATIWANNNYDRWTTSSYGVGSTEFEQDDLGPVDVAKLPSNQQMNDAFYAVNGVPAIPCTRDLEDYFRLWLPGVAAAMQAMPAGYTVQLKLTGDGQIRIFQAVEPNGGTNYLFDESTALNQVAQSASLYVGVLSSNAPIVLPVQMNFNEHYIFCGAKVGSAQIDLQILDGNQNVVADSTTYLQIVDIKQMYERWTVGDNSRVPPLSVATWQVDNLACQYPQPTDTNTPYILHVHGYNMQPWEKDRFAETEYKRLYWQGYKGRFGEFRWPTTIQTATYARAFDDSESNAWASAVGLLNKLNDLNTQYPNHVYVTAHSQGNIVVGEALRLAGNNQVVNTYVAMQAALAAHAYDPNAPTRSLGLYDDGTPNAYASYWTTGAPCYFNSSAGAGTYVNFFNTNDYALEASATAWTTDQEIKPDAGWGYQKPAPYLTDYFYRDLGGGDRLGIYFPTNTYEIFAYCDEARCHALGAQADVRGGSCKGQL